MVDTTSNTSGAGGLDRALISAANLSVTANNTVIDADEIGNLSNSRLDSSMPFEVNVEEVHHDGHSNTSSSSTSNYYKKATNEDFEANALQVEVTTSTTTTSERPTAEVTAKVTTTTLRPVIRTARNKASRHSSMDWSTRLSMSSEVTKQLPAQEMTTVSTFTESGGEQVTTTRALGDQTALRNKLVAILRERGYIWPINLNQSWTRADTRAHRTESLTIDLPTVGHSARLQRLESLTTTTPVDLVSLTTTTFDEGEVTFIAPVTTTPMPMSLPTTTTSSDLSEAVTLALTTTQDDLSESTSVPSIELLNLPESSVSTLKSVMFDDETETSVTVSPDQLTTITPNNGTTTSQDEAELTSSQFESNTTTAMPTITTVLPIKSTVPSTPPTTTTSTTSRVPSTTLAQSDVTTTDTTTSATFSTTSTTQQPTWRSTFTPTRQYPSTKTTFRTFGTKTARVWPTTATVSRSEVTPATEPVSTTTQMPLSLPKVTKFGSRVSHVELVSDATVPDVEQPTTTATVEPASKVQWPKVNDREREDTDGNGDLLKSSLPLLDLSQNNDIGNSYVPPILSRGQMPKVRPTPIRTYLRNRRPDTLDSGVKYRPRVDGGDDGTRRYLSGGLYVPPIPAVSGGGEEPDGGQSGENYAAFAKQITRLTSMSLTGEYDDVVSDLQVSSSNNKKKFYSQARQETDMLPLPPPVRR